jgi:hypothetical protein
MAPDPKLVWVELFSILAAKEIETINVPGNHYTFILEPHVPKFIRHKDERLHKVQPEVLDGASPKLKQLLGYDFKSAVSKDMGQLIGRQVRSVG